MTRLKLRDDAYYVATGDGVCILTNSGEVTLTGQSIFQWIDRLAPYLDGTHTLAELTETMPTDRREMTERVVNALRERRVVVEVEDAEVGDPPQLRTGAERRIYRREFGFLGYFGPAAERRFRAYRESTVVLVGAGRMLVATAEAALFSGSRRLRVAVTGECPTDETALAECERRSRQRDPDQRIMRVSVDRGDQEQLSGVTAGAGIVVYASDRVAVDTVRTLDLGCERAGVPFVAASLADGEAWLGPFGSATGSWPGWWGAWRRLRALDSTGTGAGRTHHTVLGDDPRADSAAPTVVANQLVREVVRLLSGTAEQEGQVRMTRIDLQNLRSQRHGFLPHPYALTASRPHQDGVLAAVDRLRGGERLDTEGFSRRVAGCMGSRLGVLGEATERDFAQIPLAVSQVRVSDPVGLLGAEVSAQVITGADLSLPDARRAAALRGLEIYGSLMVDPRRLHTRRADADLRTGDPDSDLAALLCGSWNGFVWGVDLAGGRPHELAAAHVFPALRGVRSAYLPPAGVAAGYDWAEAIHNALLGQCRRLTLTEVVESRRRLTPVDWTEVRLDERGDGYRSMVKLIGAGLDVYDVTGPLRVPALAFCLGGDTIAYACGFSFGEALRSGLADVLVWHQARVNRQAEYAPAAVPPLPQRGRRSGVVACPAWSTDEAATVARLAHLGWTAVAVPLDHDPGVAVIMPYLVNLVLTRG